MFKHMEPEEFEVKDAKLIHPDPKNWGAVLPYFEYKSWFFMSDIFLVLQDVICKTNIAEKCYQEVTIVKATDVPPHATIIRKAITDEVMDQYKITHPKLFEKTKTYTELKEKVELEKYVKISITKNIGPILAGAHFDKIGIDRLTREGVLQRVGVSPSDVVTKTRPKIAKQYKISLMPEDNLPVPRLIEEVDVAPKEDSFKLPEREKVKW